jgi:serine protease Do
MRIPASLALSLMLLSQQTLAFDQALFMKNFFSVVLVRGYDDKGGLAYGSGVVVAENQVATDCHVLRRTSKAWVSQGDDAYRIESVQADAFHDVCLLNVETMPLKPVQLGDTSSLNKGDEVMSISHTDGTKTVAGQVKSLYAYDGGNILRTSARFTLGASGSPLFDARGNLIGINTFKTPGSDAYFYALPVEWIKRLQSQASKSELPITDRAFWELPDDEKPFFMQMALPHLYNDFQKLLEVGQRWVKAEPSSAEAWYELGTAQEGLGNPDEAQKSYSTALALYPRHAEALYRMGIFAAQRGDQAEVQKIGTALANIDNELSDNFNKAVGCQTLTC